MKLKLIEKEKKLLERGFSLKEILHYAEYKQAQEKDSTIMDIIAEIISWIFAWFK